MTKQTAIRRSRMSSPANWLVDHGKLGTNRRILDFGCGHGIDADMLGADMYDLHWYPQYPTGVYDIVLCTYVLNVLPTDEERYAVLCEISSLLNKGGVSYITVRRDLKEETDTQFIVKLDLPTVYHKKGSFEIYELR